RHNMEFFKTNTKIDFMGQRWIAGCISAVLFLASIISLSVHGLNFGLDFTGGTQIEMKYDQPADLNLIREQLEKAGFKAVVQAYGTSFDVLVRIPPQKEDQAIVKEKMLSALP